MHDAQEIMSSAASNYDVPRLFIGTGFASLICILSFFALPSLRPLSSAGLFFFLTLTLYAVLMFASSYVEEEHNFWYWITSGWFFLIYLLDTRKRTGNTTLFHPALAILILHRVIRRWNQTGQKYSGAPDVVTSGIFHGNNSLFLWVLIGATYLDVTNRVSRHIARSVVGLSNPLYRKQVDPQPLDHHRVTGTLITLPLCGTAFIFKLAFTVKDAPELTYAITPSLMAWVETLDLVNLARTVFGGVALAFTWIVFAEWQRSSRRAKRGVKGQGGTYLDTSDDMWRYTDGIQIWPMHSSTCLRSFSLRRQKHRTSRSIYSSVSSSSSSVSPHFSRPPLRSQTYSFIAHLNLSRTQVTLTSLLLAQTSFFALGLNNSISSVDLSNAYNGVSGYNILAVGLLVFLSNWAGPVYWSVAGVLLLLPTDSASSTRSTAAVPTKPKRSWIEQEHSYLAQQARPKTEEIDGRKWTEGVWLTHVALLTFFTGIMLVSVMAACTALRTHLFIWTVFSPKYLFAMAWGVAWHLGVTVGLGGLVWWLGSW